jgi:hypothetical protein
MPDEYAARLNAKLAPEAIRLALIRAGAFLTGYEFVKTSILQDVKSFFTLGTDRDGRPHDIGYRDQVLPLGRNEFDASVAWLVQNDALSEAQAGDLELVRTHRHEVAHELARMLIDPDVEINVELLLKLHGIMRALDRFWISIEVDANPDFDRQEVNLDSARSGSGLLFDYLLDLCEVEPKR